MFTIDPVTGNSLGFEPNKLLTPKDAFEVGGLQLFESIYRPKQQGVDGFQSLTMPLLSPWCSFCCGVGGLRAPDRCLTRMVLGLSTLMSSRGCWYVLGGAVFFFHSGHTWLTSSTTVGVTFRPDYSSESCFGTMWAQEYLGVDITEETLEKTFEKYDSVGTFLLLR
jgi:hypothetical protein